MSAWISKVWGYFQRAWRETVLFLGRSLFWGAAAALLTAVFTWLLLGSPLEIQRLMVIISLVTASLFVLSLFINFFRAPVLIQLDEEKARLQKRINELEGAARPRRIEEIQKPVFIEALKKHRKISIKLYYVDSESRELADDIHKCCDEAGVQCSFPIVFSDTIRGQSVASLDFFLLVGRDTVKTSELFFDLTPGLGNVGRSGEDPNLGEREYLLIIGKKPVDPTSIRHSF